ncbi:MAG TPA: late competence development ComFB family protein, partial [Clostridiales bacterium]|nr:late competence development ComFB family protein [Clostridiales bacterium]
KLDMAFNKFNCCKCDRCRQDVAALALNKIKPKYIIVDENEAKDVLNNHDDPTVMSAIIQAMLTVMSHPRH